MSKNSGIWGRLSILSAALIWGTSFVVLKSALGSIDTFWTLSIRFSLSAVIMSLIGWKKLKKMDRRSFRGSVLMGVCVAGGYIFQTYGLVYTSPGKNAFLSAVYCVMVPFLAWFIYKRKPGVFNVIAALLCVSGIGFIALDSGFGNINTGDIITLASGLFYAFQIIMMEHYIDGADSVAVTAVEFSTAALICWAGALLFGTVPENVPVDAWLNILYLSVMCTAVCFFLQAWGMRYTPSSTAAMLFSLEAVFGTLLSVLFFGEQLTLKLFIGFSLIFIAVLSSETGEELYKKYFKAG